MAVTDLTIEMVVSPRHHQGQSEARIIHPGAGVLRPGGLQGRQLYRGTVTRQALVLCDWLKFEEDGLYRETLVYEFKIDKNIVSLVLFS